MTFKEFCQKHNCTPEEARKLRIFLIALRLEKMLAELFPEPA